MGLLQNNAKLEDFSKDKRMLADLVEGQEEKTAADRRSSGTADSRAYLTVYYHRSSC